MATIPERIETLAGALADALEGDDVATALVKCRAMRALLTATPNMQGALSNLSWDRNSLDQLERSLVRRKNAKGGVMTQVPARVVSPEQEDDYL